VTVESSTLELTVKLAMCTAYSIQDVDLVQLQIKDRLKNNILPSIMGLFDVILENRGGKDIIKVIVAGGLEKPYYLKKYGMTSRGCFIRIGSASEPMAQEMIDSLYSRRIRNTIGRMESPRQDLRFEQLNIYYETKGLKLNDFFMKNLELLTPEGKPNYAAYLLADENGVSLQVAKYAGDDRVELIENRNYGHCSIVKALKSVLDRVNVENTVFTRIGYPLREEREMIDSIAIREAIINAVVHNDYSYGATPKLEFFTDRVEITSMGGLPYGVEEEDFFSGFSVPRNKELMRIFRDLEIVEQLGSGVPRIIKVYGRKAFEIRKTFLRITMPYAKPFDKSEVMTTEIAPVETSRKVGETSGKTSGKIVELMKANPEITIPELASQIGVTERSIERNIQALKVRKRLERIDGAKGGHWEIIKLDSK